MPTEYGTGSTAQDPWRQSRRNQENYVEEKICERDAF